MPFAFSYIFIPENLHIPNIFCTFALDLGLPPHRALMRDLSHPAWPPAWFLYIVHFCRIIATTHPKTTLH